MRSRSANSSLQDAPPPKWLVSALGFGRRFFVIDWALRIGIGMRRHNAFLAASAMAYNFFLSLIPILALLGYILGHFVREYGTTSLLKPLGDAIPFARELGGHELERMAGASVTVAPLSVGGFLWVTSSGTSSLIDTFEIALGAKRRPWFVQRAIALAWVLGTLGMVSLVVWIAMRVDKYLGDQSLPIDARIAELLGSWEPWVVLVALGAIGILGLAVLYRYGVEHRRNRKRRTWPGAIAATIASALITWGFGAYVRDLASYTVFYGSLAAVAVVLVWLYLISLALLFGAELNAQLETS